MAEPSAMRTHKTRMGYEIIFGVLRELLGGERPVDKITRDDCRRVQALLKRLPANARKLYPSLSLEQATERAALDGRKTLSPAPSTGRACTCYPRTQT